MFIHYLKIACRNLLKYKNQNLIGVLGLAMGLVCFTLCCYIPRFLDSRDQLYSHSDRVCYVFYSGENPSIDMRKKLQNRFPKEIEQTTYVFPAGKIDVILEDNDKNNEYECYLSECDTSVFSFFSLKYIAGDVRNATHTINSAVLFESFAKTIGKPENLVGQTVLLNRKMKNGNGKMFYITGIVEDPPLNSFQGRYGICNGIILNAIDGYFHYAKDDPILYDVDIIPSYVMLRKGVDAADLQQKLDAMAFSEEEGESYQVKKNPNSLRNVGKVPQMTLIVIVGFLILLTGLLNYISFLFAQFYNRLGGYAIRKVNGSEWKNLFLMIFTEFVIVWLFAALLSFPLLNGTASFFDMLRPHKVSFDAGMIYPQLMEYVLWGIPCIALLCVFPAMSIEKLSIKTVLLGLSGSGNKAKMRDVFLFIQMFIFLGLMSATIMVYMQINHSYASMFTSMTSKEKENVFVIDCSSKKRLMDNKEALLQYIRSSSLVEKATYTYTDFYRSYSSEIDPGTGIASLPQAVQQYVSPDFPDFFNVKLISGKFFENNLDPGLAVVDENFAALYGGESPVGKSFQCESMGQSYTIIGVVQNLHYYGQTAGENFPVYYVSGDSPWKDHYIYVKPMPGKTEEARKYLEHAVREFLPPTIPFDIQTLASLIKQREFGRETVLFSFGSAFGIVALVVCLLSLYASVTVHTERRRKEVAIRKINGAATINILFLFLRKYIILLTGAALLAFPLIQFVGSRWSEYYVNHIPLNNFYFLSIYAVALLLVLITVIFRILKVARENPVDSLKTD